MRSQTYSYSKFGTVTALLIGAIISCTTTVKAQLNPLASQYYQNQYLFNPAMAGIEKGLNINLDYSKLGLSVDGQQSMQAVSAEYQMDKVGLGVNAFNQTSGIFRSTRAVVTYAYHLPLSNDQKLSFGLSAGFVNQSINTGNIVGNQNDPSVARYNANPTYVDGDFGVAYTYNKLTLQGALPNLKGLFKDDGTILMEHEVFFTSASYKLGDPSNVSLEPKVAYRQVKGFSNIVDAGANLAFNDSAFSLQGIYHSSNSATFGVGVNMSGYSLLAYYTTNTTTLNAYSNGNFEISLKFNLLKNK
jgi:type IX secretion system PorP/SprF family membrane protein